MAITTTHERTYSIKEVSSLTGISSGMLRYYESIGLIEPVERGSSSKHREYDEKHMEVITIIACLRQVGMTTTDMRKFLENRKFGQARSEEQVALLSGQLQYLEDEKEYIKIREDYLQLKIRYWHAMATGDEMTASELRQQFGVATRSVMFPKHK